MSEKKVYELPEEGNYRGLIKNWYVGETQNGTPFVEFVVYLTEAEEETGEMEPLDKPFSAAVTRYLSPGALQGTIADLKYLGYTHKTLENLDRTSPKAFSFYEKEVFVRCAHEEYQGKTRAKFNIQRRKQAATAEGLKRISGRLDSDFAAEMSKLLGEEPAQTFTESDDFSPARF